VPITRLSPAGTGVVQWTSEAGPGDPLAIGDAVAVATADGDVEVGLCVAVALGEPPQAASPSINTRVTTLARTG